MQTATNEELNAILSDDLSDLDELLMEESQEVNLDDFDEEDIQEAILSAEIEEAKTKAYIAQPAKAELDEEDKAASEEVAPVKAARKPVMRTSEKSPSAQIRAKIPKYLEIVILDTEHAAMSDSDRVAQTESFLESADSLAKKVGEKVVNLFQVVSGSGSLSVYTKIALDVLTEKGECTLADIKTKYLAHPYTPGTAGAQGSQMMTLLPALKIANRVGNKLVVNPDSALLPMLTN